MYDEPVFFRFSPRGKNLFPRRTLDFGNYVVHHITFVMWRSKLCGVRLGTGHSIDSRVI